MPKWRQKSQLANGATMHVLRKARATPPADTICSMWQWCCGVWQFAAMGGTVTIAARPYPPGALLRSMPHVLHTLEGFACIMQCPGELQFFLLLIQSHAVLAAHLL